MKGEAPGTCDRTCHSAGRFDSGPTHDALEREYSRQELIILQGSFHHKTGSRKDGTVPGGGQRRERRDGFRLVRLVMSIIFLHIIIRKNDSGGGRVPGGRKRLPVWEELHAWDGNTRTCSTTR